VLAAAALFLEWIVNCLRLLSEPKEGKIHRLLPRIDWGIFWMVAALTAQGIRALVEELASAVVADRVAKYFSQRLYFLLFVLHRNEFI
jgi:hypothetical protein